VAVLNEMICPQCHSSHPVLADEWFAELDTPEEGTIPADGSDLPLNPDPGGPEQLTFGF